MLPAFESLSSSRSMLPQESVALKIVPCNIILKLNSNKANLKYVSLMDTQCNIRNAKEHHRFIKTQLNNYA